MNEMSVLGFVIDYTKSVIDVWVQAARASPNRYSKRLPSASAARIEFNRWSSTLSSQTFLLEIQDLKLGKSGPRLTYCDYLLSIGARNAAAAAVSADHSI